MGKRRESRELALKYLYKNELNPVKDFNKDINDFLSTQDKTKDTEDFCKTIINIVLNHITEIDKIISQSATNWNIKRIAIVDRNILRMGIAQLLYMEGIPPIVVIDESVEVAKQYGTRESGKFINGILDRIRKDYRNQIK